MEIDSVRASSCRATTVCAILSPTVGTPRSSFRHAISASQPPSPEAENTSPKTSGSRSCTGRPADPPESLHRHALHPGGSLVRLDPPVRLPHQLLRYRKRLVLLTSLAHPSPPRSSPVARESKPQTVPFAPLPLQEHHHYYEPVRQRIPHRSPRPAISVTGHSPSRRLPLMAVSGGQQAPLPEPAFLRSMQKPQNRLAPPLAGHRLASNGTPARLIPGSHWSPRF